MQSDQKSFHEQQGVLFVEFALVVVFLMTLLFGGIGIGLRVRNQIIAQNLARLAGDMLYRDCYFRKQQDMPACMAFVEDIIQQTAAVVGQRVTVSLSYYKDLSLPDGAPYQGLVALGGLYSQGGAGINNVLNGPFSQPIREAFVGAGTPQTRFSTSVFGNSATSYGQMFRTSGRVMVAEIFLDSTRIPTFGAIGLGTAYEASLL